MKTNCVVIGKPTIEEEKKEITFEFCLDIVRKKDPVVMQPYNYKNIELISAGYYGQSDLMFAFDDFRHHGVFFVGNWNDGIVINN